jgi:hypothetical protein
MDDVIVLATVMVVLGISFLLWWMLRWHGQFVPLLQLIFCVGLIVGVPLLIGLPLLMWDSIRTGGFDPVRDDHVDPREAAALPGKLLSSAFLGFVLCLLTGGLALADFLIRRFCRSKRPSPDDDGKDDSDARGGVKLGRRGQLDGTGESARIDRRGVPAKGRQSEEI